MDHMDVKDLHLYTSRRDLSLPQKSPQTTHSSPLIDFDMSN